MNCSCSNTQIHVLLRSMELKEDKSEVLIAVLAIMAAYYDALGLPASVY